MIISNPESKCRIKARKLSFLLFFACFLLFNVFCLPQGYSQEDEKNIIPAIKFKDADIKIVLQSIAEKAVKGGRRVNIVTGVEVRGLVSINLENVDWLTALEAILKAHSYDYEWIGENIILVETLEKLAVKREAEALAKQQEPLEMIAYNLKFLEAQDVLNVLRPQLSPRGKITVLQSSPQKGWRARGGFSSGGGGSGDFARAKRESGARPRSNTLIITDTKSKVRDILKAIAKIDIMPRQVLIEARIMEVAVDWLKDIGISLATGIDGVTSGSFGYLAQTRDSSGGQSLTSVTPSIFGPSAELTPANTGMTYVYRKLTGEQFEGVLHALEENVRTNVLSAPRILTLDGQEAYIMVGTKRPIITSTIQASQTSVGISKQLDYYENLGIELNVVPKICGDDYINMIIYPSVTSSTRDVEAESVIEGTAVADNYPIIDVRETQTQVLVKSGETIVIGGLIKEVKNDSVIKVPLLGDIPYLGHFFKRTTTDTEKIDLIIFITATIVEP
ncbi:MAG: hypothetical protein NG737_01715 [Omnitrophica bacterium]|nr:hypothetical protein [Candidatus Omnitrophota bacterium]